MVQEDVRAQPGPFAGRRLTLMVLRQDDWLGERLGKPAFRAGAALTAADLPVAPAFVGAKVDVGDTAGLLRLQALGFRVG